MQPGGHVELQRGQTTRLLSTHVSHFTLVGNHYAALSHNKDIVPIWLYSTATGKNVRQLWGHTARVTSLTPSPDGRYLLSAGKDQTLHIWNPAQDRTLPRDRPLRPLLSLFVAGEEWVAWTQEGYYAASPGGEKLIGWVSGSDPSQLMTFHPAQRFRKQMYRPEVIKLVLEKGSVELALQAAKVPMQDIAKLLPPRASLEHRPVAGVDDQVIVEVVVQAGAKTQPLTELHLLVDGRLALDKDNKVMVKSFAAPPAKEVKETWTVKLEPGRHTLSVRALAKDTYSISDEVRPKEVKAPVVPLNIRRGTLHYVGIGVNQFQHEPKLQLSSAVPDVTSMEQCLQRIAPNRFAYFHPDVLPDSRATRARVLETLTDLQGKLKPTDVVIVHYSSHSEVDPDGGLFLLTHDSKRDNLKETAVLGEELREILRQYQCPVLMLLDTCHEGKFPPMRPATDLLSRMLADDSCGVAVMTAALARQKAKGGVFTQALIAGLNGEAKSDEVTKPLSVDRLWSYTLDTVARKTDNKQMPLLYLPSSGVPDIILK
jgi:hypothetical protein